MKSRARIMRDFLSPVFAGRGYRADESHGYLSFVSDEDPRISVAFEFMPMNRKILETTIKHPKFDDLVRIPVLIDGPDAIRLENGFWMEFDNDSDFVGLLEFQAGLFEEWIFDLLAGKTHAEVFELVNTQRRERIEEFQHASGQEQKFRLADQAKAIATEVQRRRYAPGGAEMSLSNMDDQVQELFSFTHGDRRAFRYIDDYARTIEEWLKTNSFDREQVLRYAVVGLYLQYRITAYHGTEFRTHVRIDPASDEARTTMKKFQRFNELFGKEISSTEEYLEVLGITSIEFVNGVSLANFVLNGTKVG